MTRRLALACSFALTVVVSFAVATLGIQAGWFGETPASANAPPGQFAPLEGQTASSPEVITEFVVVDVPVQLPGLTPGQQSVVAPQQFIFPQAVAKAPGTSSSSSSSSRYDDDDDDHDGDDDRSGKSGQSGRDHPEDD